MSKIMKLYLNLYADKTVESYFPDTVYKYSTLDIR